MTENPNATRPGYPWTDPDFDHADANLVKISDAQTGKVFTDVFGNRVRVDQYIFHDPSGPNPVVMFGRNLQSSKTVQRQVTGYRINRRWPTHAGRGMDQGDISVVKFAGGLPKGYRPAAIPENDIKAGQIVTLAGYGISNARTHTGAGRLRKTRVKVENPRPGKTEMILNQCKGHGACHGDSGGPAFMKRKRRDVLVGVTNRGYPNRAPDDCKHKVVYTKVAAYRPWIGQALRTLRRSPNSRGYMSARMRMR